ncbi:MAG: hypothetical protein HY296_03785 [Thaumarchaeota archaeon]|nr:hypothetical protein [Nitrososphaerota archaeon]
MGSTGQEGRRLGAIMFTDLVGFSAMAGKDEDGTLRMLGEHRRLMEEVFGSYNGRVVKSTGDGFLVEFASAVEAVNCAVEAQNKMTSANRGKKIAEMISIRIGIHVGDVVHSGGDVLGDAVNVAARVQPLADVGGICVTRQVFDQVVRKVPNRMVKIGTRDLKNIQYPVELYKVEVASKTTEPEFANMDPRRLAILPLANMSGDPEDKYFADGMTEELISTVSRIGELSVISRTSVMRYKDTNLPIGEIGRELSAGAVLEGSVRKAGNKVRITTQLIDARNDRHLWAQSYDRDLTDVFAIQGDIAERVAEALKVQLLGEVKESFARKTTVDPDAYTEYLKGRYYWNERTPDAVRLAIVHFEKAIKNDHNFAPAYSGLADCYSILVDLQAMPRADGHHRAKEYAETSLSLDGSLAEAHASLGLIMENTWNFRKAEKELETALELRPNYAYAAHWLSFVKRGLGLEVEAFEMERRAHELDPYSRPIAITYGAVLTNQGREEEGMGVLDRVVELNPDYATGFMMRAWGRSSQKDFDGAIRDVETALRLMGGKGADKINLAWIYAVAGKPSEATRMLDETMQEEGPLLSPAEVASAMLALGRSDEGFSWLNKAVDEQDGKIFFFGMHNLERQFLSDPRWHEIENRLAEFRK